MARRLLPAAIATAVVLAACDGGAEKDRKADPADPRNQPGYIVDSIHPPEEALRRFQAGLDTPRALNGAPSRDELFRRFADAVRRRDEGALARLVVTRAEYAFLVYPESRVSRPPYRQPPEIAWMLSAAATGGGMTKLLARSDQMGMQGYACEAEPEREGALRVWQRCVVHVRAAEGTRDLRLFGAIIERDGRYKFAGLNNGL